MSTGDGPLTPRRPKPTPIQRDRLARTDGGIIVAQVLVFHHVQGLTPGVHAYAAALRDAGHQVIAPDLFGGQVFDTIEAGLAYVDSMGFDTFLESAASAVDGLPADVVYAGFSLGALVAHRLAQTRPGARGALLYHHGDVPMEMFGESWLAGVDVQIHISEGDEFREEGVAEDFVEQVGRVANAELFLYPGSNHLFMDSSLESYHESSADSAMKRTLAFLAGLA